MSSSVTCALLGTTTSQGKIEMRKYGSKRAHIYASEQEQKQQVSKQTDKQMTSEQRE